MKRISRRQSERLEAVSTKKGTSWTVFIVLLSVTLGALGLLLVQQFAADGLLSASDGTNDEKINGDPTQPLPNTPPIGRSQFYIDFVRGHDPADLRLTSFDTAYSVLAKLPMNQALTLRAASIDQKGFFICPPQSDCIPVSIEGYSWSPDSSYAEDVSDDLYYYRFTIATFEEEGSETTVRISLVE